MRTLSIELTNNCNFKCIHCYCKNFKDKKSNTMSFQEFKKIVEIANYLGVLKIVLTGGEPLLVKKFEEYYLYLIDKGYLVTVLTNGSFINKYIDIFKKHNPENLEFSIYGMTSETYYSVTGIRIDIQSMLNDLCYLKTLGLDIKLKYILMNENLQDLERFLHFVKLKNLKFDLRPAMIPLIEQEGSLNTKFRVNSKELIRVQELSENTIKLPKRGECVNCEAGEYLHFTHDCKLKGCPIMLDEYKIDLDNFVGESLDNALKEISKFPRNNVFCPGWERIEQRADIEKYFFS